jgi:hypothetical protein
VTGDPRGRVPACQDIQTSHGVREMRFTISTEKVGRFVFLQIDEVIPTSGAPA